MEFVLVSVSAKKIKTNMNIDEKHRNGNKRTRCILFGDLYAKY